MNIISRRREMASLSLNVYVDDVWFFEPEGLGEAIECTVKAVSSDVVAIVYKSEKSEKYRILEKEYHTESMLTIKRL
jgi:UTP-glucose-1-phosphate uridylyltransferase